EQHTPLLYYHTSVAAVVCDSRFRNHRRLHSFPTRRSSDLVRGGPERRDAHQEIAVAENPRHHPAAVVERQRSPHDHARARWWRRSEEHTSELQSLRHLVCRLLLEKKKEK